MKLVKVAAALVCWGLLSAVTENHAIAEDYLIKGATVHTATAKGAIVDTDILVRDGKIVTVAQGITVSDGVVVIDAKDKHVTPGLINASTNLGLVEISAVSNTVDSATSLKGVGASFNISSAINFGSTLIPQNRINGLTRAIVMPRSGESIFAGQGAAIVLRSDFRGLLNKNVVQSAIYGDAGADKSGGSRAAAMQRLARAFSDAKYLKANQSRYPRGFRYEFSQSIDDLEALYSVLDRKTPLLVSANRADDIERLILLAKQYNIKLIIAGGGEAWKVADKLARAKVPVLMDPIQNLPSFESLSVRLDAAAKLYQAGVKLLFTGGGSHNGYLVRQSAGNAVAYGMPAEAAIEAMTINTAEVFGIKNYGQVEPGMDADLVIWDGDPLELTSNPDAVFVQGEKQNLVSRATRLRDRYWDLKGNHQQAYQQ